MDKNKDGQINKDEFLKYIQNKKEQQEGEDEGKVPTKDDQQNTQGTVVENPDAVDVNIPRSYDAAQLSDNCF